MESIVREVQRKKMTVREILSEGGLFGIYLLEQQR